MITNSPSLLVVINDVGEGVEGQTPLLGVGAPGQGQQLLQGVPGPVRLLAVVVEAGRPDRNVLGTERHQLAGKVETGAERVRISC